MIVIIIFYSGGKLYIQFMKLIPATMMIGEVTIAGFFALKRTPVASAMMIPLLIITSLFIVYLNQMHYKMANYLPAELCMEVDDKHSERGNLDLSFMKGKYRQPELRVKKAFPKNATKEMLMKYEMNNNEDMEKGYNGYNGYRSDLSSKNEPQTSARSGSGKSVMEGMCFEICFV